MLWYVYNMVDSIIANSTAPQLQPVQNRSVGNAAVSNASNINTVASNISNVNSVGGISSNVTTVAGISNDVTTAANNETVINKLEKL